MRGRKRWQRRPRRLALLVAVTVAVVLGVALGVARSLDEVVVSPGETFEIDGLVVGEWMLLGGDRDEEFAEPVEAMHDFEVTNTTDGPRRVDMDLRLQEGRRLVTTVRCRHDATVAPGEKVTPSCTTTRAVLPTDYDHIVVTLADGR